MYYSGQGKRKSAAPDETPTRVKRKRSNQPPNSPTKEDDKNSDYVDSEPEVVSFADDLAPRIECLVRTVKAAQAARIDLQHDVANDNREVHSPIESDNCNQNPESTDAEVRDTAVNGTAELYYGDVQDDHDLSNQNDDSKHEGVLNDNDFELSETELADIAEVVNTVATKAAVIIEQARVQLKANNKSIMEAMLCLRMNM